MGTIKQILVNREAVVENAKAGKAVLPVYTVKDGNQIQHGNRLLVTGPCVFRYDPAGSPHLGRRIWVETTALISVYDDPTSDDPVPEWQCGSCDDA